MIPLEQSAALLLCAGLSRRFGPGNKLLAPLGGEPLAAHAAALIAGLPFAARLAVTPPDDGDLERLLRGFGFDLLVNPDPARGKDSSLRLGLAETMSRGARGALVLLGDMPHVSPGHLRALADAADDQTAAISRAGDTLSPPTYIPAALARRALAAQDHSVRTSLGRTVPVDAPAPMLLDYDRPEQFGRAATAR